MSVFIVGLNVRSYCDIVCIVANEQTKQTPRPITDFMANLHWPTTIIHHHVLNHGRIPSLDVSHMESGLNN